LAYANIDDVIKRGLHAYLDDLQTKMNRVGQGIFDTFFARRMPESGKKSMLQPSKPLPPARGSRPSSPPSRATRSATDLELLLEPALEIGDSVMTHRRRYFAEPQLHTTIEVLIHDPTNPRSLTFQLAALENHAAQVN
jgi:uncharacterized alpha-E superfamily protein